MKLHALPITGLLLVEPVVHRDPRGFFVETWHAERFAAAGIELAFAQDNHSRSVRDTLRGLHYQAFGPGLGPGQAKLVRVARGAIWDVAVDLRPGSPTFSRWHAQRLDADAHAQLFIPAGCAHGFCVLSADADVIYKVSTPYDPALERGLAWDDPELAIPWPVATPLLSARDRANPTLAEARSTAP